MIHAARPAATGLMLALVSILVAVTANCAGTGLVIAPAAPVAATTIA